MKTIIYGLIVLSAALIAPAYAADDCGGVGYEPFRAAVETPDIKPVETVVANLD